MRTISFFFLLQLSLLNCLPGQSDTLTDPSPIGPVQLAEDFLQNSEREGDFDFNTILEELDQYKKNPLNLNGADEKSLRDLRLLSDIQILNLLRYRLTTGELISIYELQAIPGFDPATIQAILPFVTVKGGTDDYQINLKDMLTQGSNELYMRWSRVRESQKGFEPPSPGSTASRYLGDPNQLYLRFKHSNSNRLSYGFTAEKDRGEEFFTGSNPNGFDFYSAHFYLRDYNRTVKAVALGDYTVNFGQGLIMASGFNAGKSVLATTVKRGGRNVRAYTSVNEVNFMRGAAATIALTPNLELTAFGSYRGRDGNLLSDTSDLDREILSISSLDIDGYHRTPSEIADRNATMQLSTGGSLKYITPRWNVGLNGVYHKLDKSLNRRLEPYNYYYFSGDQSINLSADYSWLYRNFNFFGETAWSENGALATVNGLLAGLHRDIDVAVVYRNYPRNFIALNGDPFGETSGARNEEGLYLGLVLRPVRNWILSGYYDVWQHPWLRFDADAPSRGHEYRLRVTHFKKRKYEAYVEVRDETKEKNVPLFETKTNWPVPSRVFQTRFHFGYQLSKALELRSRADFGFSDNEINNRQSGFVIYQDILFHPIQFPVSFTARFALMDTDGYQARFYSFENNLLYQFSIPAYYNEGVRYYLNVRFKGIRNMTVEGRIAQTYYTNQSTFGSGLEEISGPSRTQYSAQVKYRF